VTVEAVSIVDVCRHDRLFKPWFRDSETWAAWFVFLKAMFGLPMDDGARAIFTRCTARAAPPVGGSNEAWLIVGRRGGKSIILATIAVYLACFREWRQHLSPGERGSIMILATDRRQARVIYRYVRALLLNVPALAAFVDREDQEAIELNNGIAIEIMTATFRSVRGYTVIAALLDEAAFWRSDDSANPDTEVLAALRPAMATIPNATLLVASSPYAKRGILYDAYRRHYGRDDSQVLVWQAATREMNPTVPQAVIDEATERDPANAAAEYGAEFRSDIETFIAREVVDAAVVPGRHELPPMRAAAYLAFADPSGGSADSMTLAIAHAEGERAVLDAVRERRPPFSPEDVVREFATLLATYRVSTVVGDRYGGEWPAERFREHGITYEPAERPKSDIYREVLPILNSGRAELLDLPRLTTQLCGLERRTARGGRDSIDHAPGAHDDLANAVAGALVRAVGGADAMAVWLKLAKNLPPLPPGHWASRRPHLIPTSN
jgi:hypothetical protein